MNSDRQEQPMKTGSSPAQEAPASSNVSPTLGCGIFGKYPVIVVLSFALIGIATGVGVSFWEPDDIETKDKVLKWIGLVGDMFIRSLKCIVLPLVFVNVITSVVDMMTVGKAGSIGWKTIALYLGTTVCASILGIITSLIMKGYYNEKDFESSGPAYFQFECSGDEGGSFVTHDETTGALSCAPATEDNMDSSKFILKDLSSTFVKKSSGPASNISLSQTVYEGVFEKLIPSNIFASFNEANFAAVIFFAIVFGVALGRVLDQSDFVNNAKSSIVMRFLKEIESVLLVMMNWCIMITPFAVFSLIAKAVGGEEDITEAFENVGYLVVATVMAMILQVLLCYISLFSFMTKSNPFSYLRFMIPAQTMAFACASSAATIPVTLKCVESTGKVPASVAGFVIPLGATVNMDGGAIYFPCSCIWLAVLNGVDVNFGHLVLLVVIATIGSIGTAPVPSASLVLIITAYNTVFNTTGTPDGFSFILAIDWFMDRLRTVMNVTGDTVCAGIVSYLCPLESEKAGSLATFQDYGLPAESTDDNETTA